jgi:hypothetical protein
MGPSVRAPASTGEGRGRSGRVSFFQQSISSSPQLTAFGRAAYSQFDGSTERVGTFEPQSLTPLSIVTARFGDTASCG